MWEDFKKQKLISETKVPTSDHFNVYFDFQKGPKNVFYVHFFLRGR